jgi:hypothetical protein
MAPLYKIAIYEKAGYINCGDPIIDVCVEERTR